MVKLLLRLWVTPQAVHDQRAQDHGEVGPADAHLAAEEQSGERPGRIVSQRQAGAFLEAEHIENTVTNSDALWYIIKVVREVKLAWIWLKRGRF